MTIVSHRAALVAALVLPLAAQAAEPAPGTPLRKALLDAIRPYAERDLGPPIQFLIKGMNVEGNLAFVHATPQRLNGEKIDWQRTPFGPTMKAGGMSDVVMALLRYEGGVWRVEEYAFGATDVPWIGWPEQYRFPERLITDTFR